MFLSKPASEQNARENYCFPMHTAQWELHTANNANASIESCNAIIKLIAIGLNLISLVSERKHKIVKNAPNSSKSTQLDMKRAFCLCSLICVNCVVLFWKIMAREICYRMGRICTRQALRFVTHRAALNICSALL